MGWWQMESHTTSELVLGDEPLDIAHDMLAKISQAYQEDVGRKPHLEEVLKTLEISLVIMADRYFLGAEEKELVEIRARTRKRKKKQHFAIGDYFAVPLGPERYGFGRIIDDHPENGILIVLLDVLSDRILQPQELRDKLQLFPPIFGGMEEAWTEWRWKVIKGSPIQPGEYPPQKFKIRPGLPGEVWRIWDGERYYRATEEEVMGLEKLALYPPESVEKRMRKALGIETASES